MAKNSDPVLTGEFVKTPIALLNDRALTDAELRLWLVLAAHCMNGQDTCFPSVARLAAILGKSARQVTNILGRLEVKGYIKRHFQKGKSSDYEISFPTDPRNSLQGLTDTPEEKFRGGMKKTSGDPRRKFHPETDKEKQKNFKQSTEPSARRASEPKAKKCTDPRVKELLDSFCSVYFEKFNSKYSLSGAKDGAIIKGLLADHSPETLKRCIDAFFADNDRWLDGKYNLPVFRSRINQYIQQGSATKPPEQPGRSGVNLNTFAVE